MSHVDLTPDCARCAALCCVVFAFDKSDKFAINKAAGTACPKLNAQGGCTIHDRLDKAGFGGCVSYNCNGAGQRVVQELFDGKSWQDNPNLLDPMTDAFRTMRRVHDLLLLLETAKKLPLPPQKILEIQELTAKLAPEEWTHEALAEFETSTTPADVHALLATLKDYL